ncbi:LysR family transcriptional regulator [Pantoea sp. EA-12]|uniref:LysR family transcriptional regulator n=1 Tax=Pantoea sp. EA-12 TaxID=3043303 RepID=UPI0024B610DB|nr:LysR family transcriptional regulator [Pantoea sp. EA-12]MDI9219497.1 LysR family transcriptional regulator [Pantoea sp. EA-12]
MTMLLYSDKTIRYLYEVGIHGGIRRAAEALDVDPAAISRQLSQLARDMRLPLLERRGRNVVLTEAGKLLAEDYAQTHQRRSQLERRLRDLRHKRGGSITMRVGQGMVDEVVKYVLQPFSQNYPEVFIDILSGDMQTTVSLITRGEVDMAVGFGPVGPPGVKCHSFHRGPICAIVHREHPIALYEKVDVADLAEYPLIGMDKDFGIQSYMNVMFNQEGLVFAPAYSCNLFTSAIALSQAGMGIAFMTAKVVEDGLSSRNLVAVPVNHRIARESQCHLLRSTDHRFTPAAQHLWQLLCQFFEQTASEEMASL